MIIAIRTDASNSIGTGHVMRCLTLAGVLRDKGSVVTFICREHDGNLCDLIEERGFLVHRIPGRTESAPPSHDYTPYHAPWLGSSWEEDAEETAGIISSMDEKPDWLIVDHYALDERWEKQIRSFVHRIFVIDDLADRVHDCDCILDVNLLPSYQVRYNNKVPNNCKKLLGPAYIIFRPEFLKVQRHMKFKSFKRMKNILIFFGGSDSLDYSTKSIFLITDQLNLKCSLNIILGKENPHKERIMNHYKEKRNIFFHVNVANIAELMCNADIALGTCGYTSYEFLYMKLPSILVPISEIQAQVSAEIANIGCAVDIGLSKEYPAEKISTNILYLIRTPNKLQEMAYRAESIIDGKGIIRVIDGMNKIENVI